MSPDVPAQGSPDGSPSDPSTGRPPSVDRLARSLADVGLPHPLLVDAARTAVADAVAVAIVDRLEIVDVDQRDDPRIAFFRQFGQMRVDRAAIGKAGQLVALRIVARRLQLFAQGRSRW